MPDTHSLRVGGREQKKKKVKLNSSMKLRNSVNTKPQTTALNNQLNVHGGFKLFSSTSEKLENVLAAFCFISFFYLFSVHWLKYQYVSIFVY